MDAEAQLVAGLVAATTALRSLGVAALVAGLGCFVLGLSAWLLLARPTAVGAVAPLWLGGVLFVVVGVVTIADCSETLARLPDTVREAPHRLVELADAAALDVTRTEVLRWVDLGLALVGVGFALKRGWARGFGLGLAIVMALALAFDHQALELHRARVALLGPGSR